MIDNDSKYVVTHLDKQRNKNEFTCGVDVLDRYLQIQAGQDIKKNVAVTYVLTANDSVQILGFYTLSSIGIFFDELPPAFAKKLPRHPILPGVLLGRLAVSQGQKISSHLLMDALKRSLAVSSQIGIVAVIVDAKDEKAAKFYKHFGFIELPENQNRLFLSLGTIKQLDL